VSFVFFFYCFFDFFLLSVRVSLKNTLQKKRPYQKPAHAFSIWTKQLTRNNSLQVVVSQAAEGNQANECPETEFSRVQCDPNEVRVLVQSGHLEANDVAGNMRNTSALSRSSSKIR